MREQIVSQYLAAKNVRVEATEKDSFTVELLEKADLIRGADSPEEASRSTLEVVERQVRILEEERNRLRPIAAREHWVALFFAVAAGVVFIIAIVLAIAGTPGQAIVTLIASSAPGFLSKVFFSREAKLEERLKEISADIRESEKARERLALLQDALEVVPPESRERLVEEYTKKMFQV